MRKRSRKVALAIVGAASFAALAGCREDQVDAQAFPDLQSCKAASNNSGLFSVQECETAFADAQQLNVETAPRYDSKATCEQEHGEGNCESEAQAMGNEGGGMGSIFLPLMAGYLIGNMMGGRTGMAAAQPLYKTADGKFTNAAGTAAYSSNSGKAKLNSSLFKKPQTTLGKAPMTKATLSSRGGFGSTGGSSYRSSLGG